MWHEGFSGCGGNSFNLLNYSITHKQFPTMWGRTIAEWQCYDFETIHCNFLISGLRQIYLII